MNKIKNYINYIFSDYVNDPKVEELKEELVANLSDKVKDAILDGTDEKQAINMAIESLGSIDELLASVGIQITKNDHDPIAIQAYIDELEMIGKDTLEKKRKGAFLI